MSCFNKNSIRHLSLLAIFAVTAVVVFIVVRPAWAQRNAAIGAVVAGAPGAVVGGVIDIAGGVSQAAAAGVTSIGDVVRIIVGSIIYTYTYFVGRLLLILISILVKVASYNDFVNSAVVIQGWTIVRDIANMFFIIILLAIAFGTILGVEKLDWKQRLPKLLIFAVLINFTRVIAGIVIDFGQVIMITFVNGFKDAAGGNFAELLGIRGMLELSVPGGNLQQNMNVAQGNVEGAAIDFIQVIAAMIGGAIFATISLIVILMMLLVLIYRMVLLWIYVTLSPIAFLLGAFPQGEKYYADWWNKLISSVALGPVLAFFIWLSLATVASINVGSDYRVISTTASNQPPPALSCGASELCQEDNILKFIVGIGMLMSGLTAAQGFASSAGEGMGGLVGWAKKSSTGAMKRLSGVSTVQKARQAFQKKDMQAGGLGGLLARGAIYTQAGLKGVPIIGGALGGKAGIAVEKFQSDQIALQKKKMGSLSNRELLEKAKQTGGASYEKAAAMALFAERGAINEKNFSKEEIEQAKNVFGNAKSEYGQFMGAVKKQAPALAYDFKKPEEFEQFIADAGRGVARLDNLEAKYFTDELEGRDLIKGLALGKTVEQITSIYNKLTGDAQKKWREQTQSLIQGGSATPEMQQSFADITHDLDAAFPPGMIGSDEGVKEWVARTEKTMVANKMETLKRAKKRLGGGGTPPPPPPTPLGTPTIPRPMTPEEVERETAEWTVDSSGAGTTVGTPPPTPLGTPTIPRPMTSKDIAAETAIWTESSGPSILISPEQRRQNYLYDRLESKKRQYVSAEDKTLKATIQQDIDKIEKILRGEDSEGAAKLDKDLAELSRLAQESRQKLLELREAEKRGDVSKEEANKKRRELYEERGRQQDKLELYD